MVQDIYIAIVSHIPKSAFLLIFKANRYSKLE